MLKEDLKLCFSNDLYPNEALIWKLTKLISEMNGEKDEYYYLTIYIVAFLCLQMNHKNKRYIEYLDKFVHKEEYFSSDMINKIEQITESYFTPFGGGKINYLFFNENNSKFNIFELAKRELIKYYTENLNVEKVIYFYKMTNYHKLIAKHEKNNLVFKKNDYILSEMLIDFADDICLTIYDLEFYARFGIYKEVTVVAISKWIGREITKNLEQTRGKECFDGDTNVNLYYQMIIPFFSFLNDLMSCFVLNYKEMENEIKYIYEFVKVLFPYLPLHVPYVKHIVDRVDGFLAIETINKITKILDRNGIDIDGDCYNQELVDKIDASLLSNFFDREKEKEDLETKYQLNVSKLSNKSIDFIITGNFIFGALRKKENVGFDFAGPAISWCRAVENEMKIKLYDPLVKKISNKEIENLFGIERLKPHFTLGFFTYLTKIINVEKDEANLKKLFNLLKSNLLIGETCYLDFKIFLQDVDLLRDKYRNALAHSESFKLISAYECQSLILITRKIIHKLSEF